MVVTLSDNKKNITFDYMGDAAWDSDGHMHGAPFTRPGVASGLTGPGEFAGGSLGELTPGFLFFPEGQGEASDPTDHHVKNGGMAKVSLTLFCKGE